MTKPLQQVSVHTDLITHTSTSHTAPAFPRLHRLYTRLQLLPADTPNVFMLRTEGICFLSVFFLVFFFSLVLDMPAGFAAVLLFAATASGNISTHAITLDNYSCHPLTYIFIFRCF